jgi:hypothetical protein
MKQARGEDAGIDKTLKALRSQGEEWTEYRGGIVCKTARNKEGKRATTIWYGQRRVSRQMLDMRPTMPEPKNQIGWAQTERRTR